METETKNYTIDEIIKMNTDILASLERMEASFTKVEESQLNGDLLNIYRANQDFEKKLDAIESTITIEELQKRDQEIIDGKNRIANSIKEKVIAGKVSENELAKFDLIVQIMVEIYCKHDGSDEEGGILFDAIVSILSEIIPAVLCNKVPTELEPLEAFVAELIYNKIQ